MAMAKSSRPGERRNSSTLIVAGSVLVGFFLVAVWVFTAPAAIPEKEVAESNSSNSKETFTPVATINEDAPVDVIDTQVDTSKDDSPSTEDSPSTDDSPSTEDSSATEDSSSTEDPPATEDSPSTEDSPATEDSPSTDDPPATEDSPSENEAHSAGDSSSEKDSPPAGTPPGIPDTISTQAELTTENKESNQTDFETQAAESKEEKELVVTDPATPAENVTGTATTEDGGASKLVWKVCNFPGALDFIPCLDNEGAIKKLKSTKQYQHRERHCFSEEELPKCLVPLPTNYKAPIKWPASRDQIWFSNVPHTQLVSYKADQTWVKVSPDQEKLVFPGTGTQFKHGAAHYIEYLDQAVPKIALGKHTRVILDVGCGVASFGGYLFDKDVLAMSIAPKDEHEAQVQMALERGIPAMSAVMGTQRLVFPSNVFDAVHCARCRVPWHLDDGMLLLELNRLLRPGGFFLWSATPVYWSDEESVQIWSDTKAMAEKMSWKLVAKENDPDTKVGIAVFQKPKDNEAYDLREGDALTPFCEDDDKPDAAWYVPMKACLHKLPSSKSARGLSWPEDWPSRVDATPSWLSNTEKGIYGGSLGDEYRSDSEHWKHIVEKSYMRSFGIDWSSIRKVMDMKAGYGGFAAALVKQPLWVMNIVPITEPDTLPIVFDRGLLGMYHDWCEPHSTYPRSYDLLHADHLLSTLTKKCKLVNVVMEMDRILRPDGWAIFRDNAEVLREIQQTVESLHWDVVLAYTEGEMELLVAQKRFWRPDETARK